MKKIILTILILASFAKTYAQEGDDCIPYHHIHAPLHGAEVNRFGNIRMGWGSLFYINGKFERHSSMTDILRFHFMPSESDMHANRTEQDKRIYKIDVNGSIMDGARESLRETKYNRITIKQETYHQNMRHGIYRIFDLNGELIHEDYFENNTGVYRDYHVNEQRNLRIEGYMKAGIREGCWLYYSESGMKHRRERYEAGSLHGDYLVFNETGDTIYRSTFVNGTGEYKEFDFETGRITIEGQYEYREKVGMWYEYEEGPIDLHSDQTKIWKTERDYDKYKESKSKRRSIYSIFVEGKEYHIYAEVKGE